jgi:ribosomal protein S27AE
MTGRAHVPSEVVDGHPDVELLDEAGEIIQMLTVCASCGQARSILFLDRDRWYCSACRAEGSASPKLYPVA